MAKSLNSKRMATLRAVAKATYPDADPTEAVKLWLEHRTKADAVRWTAAEARLYACIPLTNMTRHRHRWTTWKRSGVLCKVEVRRCLDCPTRQTRPCKVVMQAPTDAEVACKHVVTSWSPDGTRLRNRAERRRGPPTEHGPCLMCGCRVTRTSPPRRRS